MTRGQRLLLAVLQRTTQACVGARVRVAQPHVSEWLNGERVPSERARGALERAYGIPRAAWDTEYRIPRSG
jgi:transcriptional regulator with XRE-family HTH domain